MSANTLRENCNFSLYFIKIFQQPHQLLISKCLSNILNMFAKLFPGAYGKNYSEAGAGSLKMPTRSLNY